MATLLLTAVGTAVGGPLGGAIGALAGRTIDGAVIGGNTREGPRLRELAVTTSSYGSAIPRHHGRMRAAGTIIWATDLVENRESTGGGKSKPKTTSYSYSTSFAVALSSRPIEGIGRIWADGELLRGEAGDLKVGGSIRVHGGRGDQPVDPLIASAEGARCPAFRNIAYAVFEDLQLADFGNRIPALTFEIIADSAGPSLAQLTETAGAPIAVERALPGLAGFTLEGGPLVQSLAAIDSLYPLALDAGGDRLSLAAADALPADPILLPSSAAGWDEGDFGAKTGASRQRESGEPERPEAVRYYDTGRDYQPGVQRAGGRTPPGLARSIEFPGALGADDARALANAAAQRAGSERDRLAWRVAELDPALAPGRMVRVPGHSGHWRIAGWEWRERGVELELLRLDALAAPAPAGDGGAFHPPADLQPTPTVLRAFELPWDGTGSADVPAQFAAVASGGANWSGAALYVDRAGALEPIGTASRAQAIMGETASALGASAALLFEPQASLDVILLGQAMEFTGANLEEIARGANRLLVGSEILQFMHADQVADRRWQLSGLLRGRGGSEASAQMGHPAGTPAVLLDGPLVALDAALVPSLASTQVVAIGLADPEPVITPLENAGASLRPLVPVHARATPGSDGGLDLRWTRRARGGWAWPDAIEQPLVEERELYRVGAGPVEAPIALFEVPEARLSLGGETLDALRRPDTGTTLWVRQIGRHAASDPLLLATLPPIG